MFRQIPWYVIVSLLLMAGSSAYLFYAVIAHWTG